MSIQVISNSKPTVETPEVKTEAEKEENTSALAEKPAEQKEAPESDTEATETQEDESDETEGKESEETESEETEEAKPKKKGGFQRRIDKLNARYTAAQSEIEHWKAMALKSAGETPKPGSVETKQAPSTEGKPTPEKFENYTDYAEALADWKVEQKLKARDEAQAKSKLETEQKTKLQTYAEREKAFAAKTEDYQDVLENVDDIRISPAVGQLLVESENGPELAYELAKDKKEYARINALPPLAAAREIGKIESRIASFASEAKKPETKKTTNAPKPISPVGKGSAPVVRKSLHEVAASGSQAEYEALRDAEEAKKRKQA